MTQLDMLLEPSDGTAVTMNGLHPFLSGQEEFSAPQSDLSDEDTSRFLRQLMGFEPL